MKNKLSLRVGVIGVGAIGTRHLQGFQKHPLAEVVRDCACRSPKKRAREAAEEFGVSAFYRDYRLMLARDDIDAVSIALPNYLHLPVGIDALRAGKHVLLEKPMAISATQAKRLVAEAKRRRRHLMVGQSMRFTPEVQTAKTMIEAGIIGDIYHAKTAWCRRSGIPRIGSWFTRSKFAGGGCTYDIGVHALDRCLYLLGDFDAAAVSGQTYSKMGKRGRGEGTWGKGEIDPALPFDVEDLSVALIKLRSGRTVLLEASWAASQKEHDINRTQLFGTEAGLLLPPVELVKHSRLGFVTEAIASNPGKVGTDRMVHFVDVVLGPE